MDFAQWRRRQCVSGKLLCWHSARPKSWRGRWFLTLECSAEQTPRQSSPFCFISSKARHIYGIYLSFQILSKLFSHTESRKFFSRRILWSLNTLSPKLLVKEASLKRQPCEWRLGYSTQAENRLENNGGPFRRHITMGESWCHELWSQGLMPVSR